MKQIGRETLGPRLDEREQQINADYEWCLHDPEVRRRYGGRVVVAYQHRIWGAGKDHAAAWAAAAARKRGCPPRGHAAIVVVPDYVSSLSSRPNVLRKHADKWLKWKLIIGLAAVSSCLLTGCSRRSGSSGDKGSGRVGEDGWKEYVSKDFGFSVMLPGAPQTERREEKPLSFTVKYSRDNTQFVVRAVKTPGQEQGIDSLMEDERKGPEKIKGEVRNLKLGDVHGREFDKEVFIFNLKKNQTIRMRLYAAGET